MSIFECAQLLATHIRTNHNRLVDCLTSYETHKVAVDEIQRSLDLLDNLAENGSYFDGRVNKILSFLPINQPLYALCCFGVIPSFQSHQTFVRPPVVSWHLFTDLENALNLSYFVPNLTISQVERNEFIRAHLLQKPDAVIFTGKPENASEVQNLFGDDVLFIGNDASHNPVLVTQSADITNAVDGVIEVQLYNQGADCAAPNSILVHASVYEEFLIKLHESLSLVKVGDYADKGVLVGPLVSEKHFKEVIARLTTLKDAIHPDKQVRYEEGQLLLYPTVITKPLCEGGNYEEWLAPVFFIQRYDSDSELSLYFENPAYYSGSGYVTVYGESDYVSAKLEPEQFELVGQDHKTVIHDTHLHAPGIERGVKPYGGYGVNSSFIAYQGYKLAEPTLPQRDIYQYLLAAKYDVELISNDFSQVIHSLFNDQLDFFFFSGSVAYGGGRLKHSDIDVAVVLKKPTSETALKEHSISTYIQFAKAYTRINKKYSFIPDDVFPGELLTQDLIEEAIRGRGFSVKDSQLHLPIASTDYYLSNINHWFRAWLSMTAFSVFGGGNKETFMNYKNNAWKTVILYLALKTTEKSLSVFSVLNTLSSESNKWIGLGITSNYYSFHLRENAHVRQALEALSSEGYFTEKQASFHINRKAVLEWEKKVIHDLYDDSIAQAQPLTSMDDVKTIMTAINDPYE